MCTNFRKSPQNLHHNGERHAQLPLVCSRRPHGTRAALVVSTHTPAQGSVVNRVLVHVCVVDCAAKWCAREHGYGRATAECGDCEGCEPQHTYC